MRWHEQTFALVSGVPCALRFSGDETRRGCAVDESERLLRAWLAAGDAGEVDAFDRYLSPAVVVHAPMGLSSEGIAAEQEVWRQAKAAMTDLRHDVRDVVSSGELVAARAVVTGTIRGEFAGIRADGLAFTMDQAVFARVRGGLIVEAWEIADTGAVLRPLPS